MFMLKLFPLLAVCLSLSSLSAVAHKQVDGALRTHERRETTLNDSIISGILSNIEKYADVVRDYEAEMYVRGEYKVHKRNFLLRYVPSMFRFYKGVSDYVTEAMGEMQYTAPDVYQMKIRMQNGTFNDRRAAFRNTLEYLNMNIYSPTLLPDKLISPLSKDGVNYYTYRLNSVTGEADSLLYNIGIIPKNKSNQLVNGSMIVDSKQLIIREISLKGKIEFIEFHTRMKMGETGIEQFLPKRFDIGMLFSFMWNKIESSYTSVMDYRSINVSNQKDRIFLRKKSKYDLTDSYLLKCDDSKVISDSAEMANVRPFPLTKKQQRLYRDYYERKSAERITEVTENKTNVETLWNEFSDILIGDNTLNLENYGSLHLSPVFNPFMMSYSRNNGLSYKLDFKYIRRLENDKWFSVLPRIGYNFTRKEFYWKGRFEYFYNPSKLGAFLFEIGNGNRIYTSRLLDEFKAMGDSLINFDKIHLDYFYDNYLRLGNRYELTNGLNLFVGVAFHQRKAVRSTELVDAARTTQKLRPEYTTFAPRIALSWTPGLYYYMNGKRKVNLRSSYPTLSVDYERGIKGVLGSNGAYGRVELDMQQRIKLSPMNYLFYRVGGGAFTEQNNVYFVDFENFANNNLPTGWNDDIGGTFQLLDRRWYNSSRWYNRMHVTLDAPFLFLPHLKKITSLVDSERLYLGTLFTANFKPYIEFGYGIGTPIFDFGMFVNNINGEFSEFGCKFTFQLFSR